MAGVLTYGDLMLDVLMHASCHRMSPEAPASPVLLLERSTSAPGGAANVAVNIASLGGLSLLVGAVGPDPTGWSLANTIATMGIESALLPRLAATTTKVRFISARQQVMRLDIEAPAPLTAEEEDAMLARVISMLPKTRVVVISDYAKGAVTPRLARNLIMAAAARDTLVVVDTKTPAAEHFRGAAVIKPNLPELAAALGQPEPQTDDEAAAAAQALRLRVGAAFVVLTRGARGLCIVGEPGEVHVPGYAVEAVDVTGAGDAVAAALALALADGESIIDAARFANAAGAAAVGKAGTTALSLEEVRFFYDRDAPQRHRAGKDMAGERPSHRFH